MNRSPTNEDFDDLASPASLVWAAFGVMIGALLALIVLPRVVPSVVAALSAPQPKVWWQLSRVSGLVSYALLSLSMLLGLLLSTKLAKSWPGSATAFSLHEHASILGLGFASLHAIVLLGDRHTPFTLAEIALPFGAEHRPIAVGIGQLATYGMALLVGSFYVRKRIGQRAWRALHFLSFLVFALVTVHAFAAGSDRLLVLVGSVPMAAILFFGIFRALATSLPSRR